MLWVCLYCFLTCYLACKLHLFCTYNVTLRCVRVTIVAVEKQQVLIKYHDLHNKPKAAVHPEHNLTDRKKKKNIIRVCLYSFFPLLFSE